MSARQAPASGADRSREIAEASREKQWRGDSFLREVFLGKYRYELFEKLALGENTRPEFRVFYQRLHDFLAREVDPVAIDASGEYPRSVLHGLAELGAFGMKIPKEYGGLGLTHAEYVEVMQLLGSHDSNITALLSAHQAIGVPQPVRLFGTEEQKRTFLPRCARGAISAFALTEPAVGSDPASLATTATLSADGSHYILNGEKLWCTNGTLAELLVVMARDPATERINALIVETAWPGVTVEHRCHFMGLRALANAALRFDDVRVPRANLIGAEGAGLKIALVTLNTGRLSLPAATAGLAKRCTEIVRKWSNARVQWGKPIGKHEAVAHMNAEIACSAFAMDAVARVVGELADRSDVDIRLEAAAAKEWNTVRAWQLIDQTLQIRGGRGYETEASLAARGEPAVGVERFLRDVRIDRIFEGSSEIMHLFMAREAVDKHLRVAGVFADPRATLAQRLRALPRIALFYAVWYPSLWLAYAGWPRYASYGPLAPHLRFAERACRKLARSLFYGMLRHGAALERRQMFLFRAVDIAMEIFVLTSALRRADVLRRAGAAHADGALALATLHARAARERIRSLFHALFHHHDQATGALAKQLLSGEYVWLEAGAMPLGYSEQELVPGRRREQPEPARFEGPFSAPAQSGLSPRLDGGRSTHAAAQAGARKA